MPEKFKRAAGYVCLAVAAFLLGWMLFGFNPADTTSDAGIAALRVPDVVSFETPILEYSEETKGVQLENSSAFDIKVSSFRPTSAAVSFEPQLDKNGLLVPAGSSTEFKLKVAPKGQYGKYAPLVTITWEAEGVERTTTFEVDYDVLGGINAYPSPVIFSDVHLSAPQSAIVHLYDAYPVGSLTVSEIRCSPELSAEISQPSNPTILNETENGHVALRSEFVHRHDLKITLNPVEQHSVFRGKVDLVTNVGSVVTILVYGHYAQ